MKNTMFNTSKTLHFNSEGKLRIMHVTDTHLEDYNDDMTVFLIGEACDREQPDIVIVTGDTAYDKTLAKTKYRIDKFMSVFQARNIPVAITFGNHDSEVSLLSREELTAYYTSYSCCISGNESNQCASCSTYNIPVLSHDGSKIKFNLWIFDSGDYDNDIHYNAGHYGCVSAEHVQWYKDKSDELTRHNSEKVYSLAFQHIIVPEVYDVLKKAKTRKFYSFPHMYNEKEFYMFDSDQTNFGTLNETPCCGYCNYGQFDAMVEKGDVLGIFTGHDHTNAFGVKYKGIDIVNSLSTRYNGDSFSTQYGYRIIDINEEDTSVYTCRIERWYNMFTLKEIYSFKSKGNELARKTAFMVTFKGYIQRFYTYIGRRFVTLFTGRQVTYKD